MQGDYKLMEHFFHTEEYDANMTMILYGMVNQAAQEVDVNLITDLTDELFKNVDGPPGSDLASRNIQVGPSEFGIILTKIIYQIAYRIIRLLD